MTGSEKQTKWAEEIQAKMQRDLATLRSQAEQAAKRGVNTPAEQAQWFANFDAAVAAVLAHTDATWYIDHRNATTRDLIKTHGTGLTR